MGRNHGILEILKTMFQTKAQGGRKKSTTHLTILKPQSPKNHIFADYCYQRMRLIQHIILTVLIANGLMPMVDKALDGKVSELIGYDLSQLGAECEADDYEVPGHTGAGLVHSNKQTLQEPKPNDVDASPSKMLANEPLSLVVLPYTIQNSQLSREAGLPKISSQLKRWTYYSKSSSTRANTLA